MSGALVHPASSQDHQQLHANGNGDDLQNDDNVDSHIVELSEMIDHEIRSSTRKDNSSEAETIFRVELPMPNNKKQLQAASAGKMKMSTYQPAFLSIGPYHINATEEMRRNEQKKFSPLHDYIRQGGQTSVLEYTQAVKSMEDEARRCYEGDVGMDTNAFCRMLLLDAFQLILLLEFVARCAEEDDTAAGADEAAASPSQSSSPSPSQGCRIRTRNMIMTIHDLLMLENQIPFFVVEKIYELQNGDAAVTMTPVCRLAWKAIRTMVGGAPSSAPNDGELHLLKTKFQHLVHVCHVYLKPTCLINVDSSSTDERNKQKTGKYRRFRRATEYYEAGVTFRQSCSEQAAGSSSSQQQRRRPMLDVAFSNGVLSVALQDINENTGYILANVLAYEQKYHRTATSPDTSYVTAYVVFMSQLLGSADDVALLSRRGVVQHLLGDDAEVCALFRGLADGLAFDPHSDHYLNPVGEALQAHCRNRSYRWRAWIVRHRFGNPWMVAAWMFGAAAVLCTIVQTVFTVLSYVQQARSRRYLG